VTVLAFVLGGGLIAIVLWDAFETMVLPRSVSRRIRLTGIYYRRTWRPWAAIARRISADDRRERFLAVYGPLSLIGLVAVWALGLFLGFGLLQWAMGSKLEMQFGTPGFLSDLYMSGTTLFTLGLGDVTPTAGTARVLTVVEAGTGFGFLALVIAYLPVLYQSFSRREVRLTLLDAWAGSPPAGVEVLLRLSRAGSLPALDAFLKDWEYWCSEVLESHISFPATAYFRSQHQRQSWVSALSAVLDLSALVSAGIDGVPQWQARVTFAIARHTVVDLTQVLNARVDTTLDRLPAESLTRLRLDLESVGLRPVRSPEADAELTRLRKLYEPYVLGLGARLMMPVSAWRHETLSKDNWQTSPKRDGGGHI
jgi:hypothetical protein